MRLERPSTPKLQTTQEAGESVSAFMNATWSVNGGEDGQGWPLSPGSGLALSGGSAVSSARHLVGLHSPSFQSAIVRKYGLRQTSPFPQWSRTNPSDRSPHRTASRSSCATKVGTGRPASSARSSTVCKCSPGTLCNSPRSGSCSSTLPSGETEVGGGSSGRVSTRGVKVRAT